MAVCSASCWQPASAGAHCAVKEKLRDREEYLLNILCLSAFSAAWDLHGYIEMSILQALREKNANVINVVCDIKSQFCYLNLHGEADCAGCRRQSAAFYESKNMPYLWLSRFAKPDDHERVAKFVDSLDPAQYLCAEFEGKKVGAWVESTFISYSRTKAFDHRDLARAAIYRGLLIYGCEVAAALERLLSGGRYDRALVFNGRFSPFSIFMNMAEAKNIPCYLHERGMIPDTMRVVRHDPELKRLHPMVTRIPHGILEIPLAPEQLEKTQSLMLKGDAGGAGLNWDRFAPAVEHEDLRAQLGIGKDERIWAFFASSDDELAAFRGYEYPDFPTQLDGLISIVKIVSRFPDTRLVVRIHPNSGKKGDKRQVWVDRLTNFLRQRNYKNVSIVGADDPVNTYELMRIAEAGLISNSSCGGEMLHRGKPVMAFDKFITGYEGIFIADTLERMAEILDRFHKKDISKEEFRECFRKSLRYKYFRLFRVNIPFETLRQTSPHTVKSLFRRVDEIKGGRFPMLDKLADQILRGEEIGFDYMSADSAAPNQAAEDKWIDLYMERWQNWSDNGRV